MSPADLVPRFTKSPRLLPLEIAAKLDTLVHVQMCPPKQRCTALLNHVMNLVTKFECQLQEGQLHRYFSKFNTSTPHFDL